MSSHHFDSRSWDVDLPAQRVAHVSGFSARICSMPMADAELRELNAEGLVAIGTVRAENGSRWAVLATAESISVAERWVSRESQPGVPGLSAIAQHAAKAWLTRYLPPATVDEFRQYSR